MIALKKILVPTDFSNASEAALAYGKAMAETFKAALHVLHVIEDPFVHGWTSEGYVAALPSFRAEMEKSAREHLDSMLTEEERKQLQAELVTKLGSPFVEIVRYAKNESIDLIVMGTHGRGPVAHMLLGSVAEKVVRKAPCPVLTVRHPEHEFVMP
jgi:nucleotide-binding universal stress UspA family protein